MAANREPSKPIAIYYSYHKEDHRLLNELDIRLGVLKRQRYITTWHIGLVEAGGQVKQEDTIYWEQAQIILLMISPEYLADSRCYKQMELAVDRAKHALSQVIPVLVSSGADLERTPLRQFQPLPKDGRPLSCWRQKDLALADIVRGVESVINTLIMRHYAVASANPIWNDTLPSRKILSDALPPHNHHTILKREHDIQEIYSKLIQHDTSAVVLTGLDGIGKSTLAAQVYDYAEQQRLAGKSPFNREALWLRIQPNLTLRSLATKIAISLEQEPSDLESLCSEELALKLLHFLNNSDIQRLIILDDFDVWLDGQEGKVQSQYTGVGEWLDMLNRSPCTCRILITTCILPQGNSKHRQMCIKEFPLQGLVEEEVEMLFRLWQIQINQKELQYIVEQSKGHLSALVLLDKFLKERHISLTALLNDVVYKRLWTSDLEENLFCHIYEQFDVLQRSLLITFALYREAVPWHAVYVVVQTQQQVTEEPFHRALRILLNLTLLQRHASRKEERYELHPLVVKFIRRHLDQDSLLQENIDKRSAHAEAARYYQSHCLDRPLEEQRLSGDIHWWIEAVWHNCQAEQWQEGYKLLRQGNLFPLLERLGEYAVLHELYTLFLLSGKWHPDAGISASMYNELGEIYTKLGEKSKAQSSFEKVLQCAIGTEDSMTRVKALNSLGAIYRSNGQIEKALAHYQEAMNFYKETTELLEKGITLNNVGRALQDQGQSESAPKESKKYYREALVYYKQALDLHWKANNEAEIAKTTNNLGEIYCLLGEVDKAHSYFQQSLNICRRMGTKRDEGIVYNNLGTFYREKEQYSDALEYYLQALSIFQHIGTRLDEAIVLRNCGHIYIMMQRNEVAFACFLLARDIYEEMRQPRRGEIGKGLQLLLLGDQSFEQAVMTIGQNAKQILEEAITRPLVTTSQCSEPCCIPVNEVDAELPAISVSCYPSKVRRVTMKTTKILFLAANPVDEKRLILDEELRRVKEQAATNSAIDLVEVLAARPDDWLKELNAQHFRMVHFSGHGTPGGALQHVGNDGGAQPVSFQALKATLQALKGDICIAVFNACYSRKQAAMIAEDIDCVIAMNDAIHDEVAATFSKAFYRALFTGKSVQNAFEQGKAALMLEGLPEVQIPELLVKPGSDASKIMLIKPVHRDKAVILFGPGSEDERRLKELHTHLDSYKQQGSIDYWDRTLLLPGSKTQQETQQALTSARVAILLISSGFLASPDIMKNQLPILLQTAEGDETKILCVLLSWCGFNDDPNLKQFTFVNSEPLSRMSRGERDKIWNTVATLVRDILQNA